MILVPNKTWRENNSNEILKMLNRDWLQRGQFYQAIRAKCKVMASKKLLFCSINICAQIFYYIIYAVTVAQVCCLLYYGTFLTNSVHQNSFKFHFREKVDHKMMEKLTPTAKFTNILRAALDPIFFCQERYKLKL